MSVRLWGRLRALRAAGSISSPSARRGSPKFVLTNGCNVTGDRLAARNSAARRGHEALGRSEVRVVSLNPA
jgi:hypothetical protein